MIELGRTYTDKITGFKGVAIGHVEYITGCNQTLLAAKAEGGKPGESVWFDDQRVHVQAIDDHDLVTLDNGRTPGCDREAPRR